MRDILILAAALTALPIGSAFAQPSAPMTDGMAMSGEALTLPAACEAAAGSTDMSRTTSGMDGMMSGDGMTEVVKANRAAMMSMQAPMTKMMTIEDADLAFNCGMIVHHQGAIAMAEVELAMGRDDASKALAQTIIDDQMREIATMTAWIEANAN